MSSESEFGGFAFVKVFKCDIDTVDEIFRAARPSLTRTSPAAKESATAAEESTPARV